MARAPCPTPYPAYFPPPSSTCSGTKLDQYSILYYKYPATILQKGEQGRGSRQLSYPGNSTFGSCDHPSGSQEKSSPKARTPRPASLETAEGQSCHPFHVTEDLHST